MHPCIHASIHLPIHQYIHSFIHLSAYLCIYPSIYWSICFSNYPSSYPLIHPPIHFLIYPAVFLYHQSLSIYEFTHSSMQLSIWQRLTPCRWICLCKDRISKPFCAALCGMVNHHLLVKKQNIEGGQRPNTGDTFYDWKFYGQPAAPPAPPAPPAQQQPQQPQQAQPQHTPGASKRTTTKG